MKKLLANRFMARLGVAGAIASATLFGLPVHAQDSRLSLADRVSRLEQQSQKEAGTTTQVNDLQQQLSQLQGQIEELQHQNQQLQDSQKAQYADVDSRLSRLEKGGAAQAQSPAAPANAPQGPAPSQAQAAVAPAA